MRTTRHRPSSFTAASGNGRARLLLRTALACGWVLGFLLWLWTLGVALFAPFPHIAWRIVFAAILLAGVPAGLIRKRTRTATKVAVLMIGGLGAAGMLCVRPSNDRDWSPDLVRVPTAEIRGDRVVVRNVRNCSYRSVHDFDVRWEDREYDLSKLRSVEFVVEPFAGWSGPAHTLLTFGFDDERYLALSVETRRERGEHFSIWGGLYRNLELAYVLGDERDLIALRANHRRDDVYLYPVRADRTQVRELFLDVLERANRLAERPEFYNTLTSTCTTNLVDHVNRAFPGRIPFAWEILAPGFSDGLAHELGLIDAEGTVAELRERFRINDRAAAAAGDPAFSRRIREVADAR